MLKTMELFSGTGSFSQVALKLGHGINTFDLADHADELAPGTHTKSDVLDVAVKYPDQVDMLWASPPCEGFSVAAIGRNWGGGKGVYLPKTDSARMGLQILDRTVYLISSLRPTYWYIENPRGMMRKKIDEIFERHEVAGYVRHTVMYCKYGDKRMKPTDIWTNDLDWLPRPPCRNYRYDALGEIKSKHCHHESARRGAKTGTQGVKGARNRSIIPSGIFEEIFESNALANLLK